MHMCVFIYTVNIVTNPVHALPFAHHQMSSCLYIDSHTTPEHVSRAERGAERAKYSRSGFLTKGRSDRSVSVRFRSDTAHTTSLGHAQIHPECCVLIFLSAPMLICLTLPVAYARIRCSPTTPQPRPRDRIEVKRIFSAAVTQQTHSTSATQAVCPRRKASVENGRC